MATWRRTTRSYDRKRRAALSPQATRIASNAIAHNQMIAHQRVDFCATLLEPTFALGVVVAGLSGAAEAAAVGLRGVEHQLGAGE
jgi:hypothetical protein